MEISLTSFSILHPALAIERSSVTIVAELVWPRPAISSRIGVKAFDLRKGKASLSRRPNYDRLLLKERVDGNFGLVVGITKPGGASSAAAAEILGKAISALGVGLSTALSLPSTSLRSLIREPFGQLADLVEDEEISLIAEAGLDLNSEEDWEGKRTLELKTTKTLKILVEPKSGPRTKIVAKKQKTQTLRKGTIIGEVVLELQES
jgi:hypothetical protein